MKLKKFSILLGVLLLCGKQGESGKPNFVFILADDLGWADVTCNFPDSFYETPNIDKLAFQGFRFVNAYSSCPVCSPTRASIMTGKYPVRVGITDWIPGDDPKNRMLIGPADRNELAAEEVTLAELLKQDGYKTCLIGKWHLGGEGFSPENQGFEVNIGGFEAGSPPGGYYSPYKNRKMNDGPQGEYLTDRQTDEAIRFMEGNRENPFFVFLSYYTVHTPIQASRKHSDYYNEKSRAMNLPVIGEKLEGEGKTRINQSNPDYASMVASLDENIGRIMKMLDETGLSKDTWIIFTSDNGGLSTLRRGNAPTANGPLRAGKGWCYEGGIRVPLVISGPGIGQKGMVSDYPVISMDLFSTVIDLAGIKAPVNDGISFVPLLASGRTPARKVLYWHYPHYHGSGWTPGSAIRLGNEKLIIRYEDNRAELYNLKDDPGEMADLSAAQRGKVRQLKKSLING